MRPSAISLCLPLTPISATATQSGGYSADERVWERDGQKGRLPQNGLIEQSLDGGDLKHELQDAKQGKDAGTRPKTDNFVGEGPR